MAKIDFGGVMEEVITSEEFSLEKAREVLKKEIVAVLGYGVQGPGQALNMRDNGIQVIVGQRKGGSLLGQGRRRRVRAREDPFPHRGSGRKGHHHPVSALRCRPGGPVARGSKPASTGGCPLFLPRLRRGLQGPDRHRSAQQCGCHPGRAQGLGPDRPHQFPRRQRHQLQLRRFSGLHGPGPGTRCLALGIAIGSGYLFPTTFENEVYSDLTGERGVLMGCLAGVMEAQYNLLRKNGHSPSEAFNETVEELTQSLIRLVAENGMDWMFANCSTTAQRGALDWAPRFRDAVAPVFDGSMRVSGTAERPGASWTSTAPRTTVKNSTWSWTRSRTRRCGGPGRPSGHSALKTEANSAARPRRGASARAP